MKLEELESPMKLVVDKNKVKNVNADEVKKAINKWNKNKKSRRKRELLNSDWGKSCFRFLYLPSYVSTSLIIYVPMLFI